MGFERCNFDAADVAPFTEEELLNASGTMKNRKSRGPDGIPVEVLKIVAGVAPEVLLNMFNSCLMEGTFHQSWKQQKLVLIAKKKDGDPQLPSSYRPLCMLDTAGKLYEKLLRARLRESVDNAGGLHDRQFGFRIGRSTVGAVCDILNTFFETQRVNSYSRPIVALVTLDVRNAFNTASWSEIMLALERDFSTPAYLLATISDYLNDRTILYDTSEGRRSRKMYCGVAQGSVLGPELWNIFYDGIFRLRILIWWVMPMILLLLSKQKMFTGFRLG